MPGIFGSNIKNSKQIMDKKDRIYKNIETSDFYLELSSIKKFENDKGLFENDSYILLIDGVILNLSSLKIEYNKDNLFDLSISMYEKNEEFFNDFRGLFCGFFKDKKNDKTYIFTNHYGDKTIFYYLNKKEIIFSSEIKYIVKLMNDKNINYNIDESGIYSILTYGYMYNDITPINNIRRLLPGEYIFISNDSIKIKKYYKLKNKVTNDSDENTILSEIDKRFKAAVKLQIDKNEEYGYDNYAPLSAGLDSRMTNYVLRNLYDGDIVNMTYSETNQLDFVVPSKISKELKNKWLFKNLDNGLDLYDIDESFKYTDGMIYYAWPSQLNDYMKLINTDNMGIVHTGVIGDVIIGTFFKEGIVNQYKLGDGAFSKKLLSKLKVKEVKYDNKEIGLFYSRATNGAVLGYSTTFQNYTECMSPFMDVDFTNYCLSLPLKYRFHHNIYYKWVSKYYPNASKYSHNGVRIPKEKDIKIRIKNKDYSIYSIKDKIVVKLKQKFDSKYNMNPFDYWYNTNEILKKKMDSYYEENIKLVDKEELKNDIIYLYKNGKAQEKIQVISTLSIFKNYRKGIKKDEI